VSAVAARPAVAGHLGELLEREGLLTRAKLDYAMAVRRRTKRPLGALLLELNLVAEPVLHGFLARRYALESIDLSDRDIDPEVLRLVPPDMACKHEAMPVARDGNVLTVALTDPTDLAAIDEIGFATGLRVRAVLARRTHIRHGLARHYGAAIARTDTADARALAMDLLRDIQAEVQELEVTSAVENPTADAIVQLKASAGETPVIRVVNRILVDAVDRGASDVHLEPYEYELRVRFRIDGILYEALVLPKVLEPPIVSRLKVMADLDIAERRMPQDGRIRLRYDDREIDVRVSIVPTLYGEKTSLRILDRDATSLDLSTLGFDQRTDERFRSAIGQPHGMVLVTGPTGAGKTTTLYAAINALNSPDVHIMTAEDPIEYRLRGINQVQINEAIGRTFAATLRSFLRQDPDVIMVGEMRDTETAQMSVRAALTGHLVLSTVHTNDCPSTIARLIDMGVPPFLVASSLLLVLAQRLVRKVCAQCAQPESCHDETHGSLRGLLGDERPSIIYRGKGCLTCNNTGFKGREAIYEVMPMTDGLREAVSRNAPTDAIRALAQAEGMRTLRQVVLDKVRQGITTLDEALRITTE
jgi:type IV pilus assembly protein PilB